MAVEIALLLVVLAVALWMRPWQLMRSGTRLGPLLAALTLLPWLWALPRVMDLPLQLQLSGACAVTLVLGWPLAVPVLVLAGLFATFIASIPVAEAVSMALWLGVAPATFALGIGVVLRRWPGEHPFVYILGRAFFGTALANFVASALAIGLGHTMEQGALDQIGGGLSMVGHWLMAWGDAFLTGMMAAIFVAYKPQWLATWSDQLYLKKP